MAEGLPAFGEAAPGDHLQTGYNLWLVGHQLEEGQAPWRDPYSFQPMTEPRWNLAGWPYGYVYWPLERAFGTVLAWNVFVLLGFIGAGGLAALWLGELGLRRGATLVGGLAFALAPYLQAQWSAGHLLAWSALLLPLSLYALERARRGSLWWLAPAGAALVSIPLSGQLHLSLAAITFFCGYAFVRFRWAALLGAPAIAAGLVAYVLAVRDTTGASGRQFRQVEHYSASVSDFFSRNTDDLERVVYIGLTVVGLAIAGLIVLIARRRLGLALVLGLGALIPILFALGSNLPGYEILWRHLPGLHHTRVPERLMPVACLALAALVAIAVSRLDWPGTAAMAALLLVVELPLGMFNETAADQDNRAYVALRDQPPGRMLELPVFRSGSHLASTYLYYLKQAPREHPSGYSTTAPLEADRELLELRRSPCRDLSLLGVRYLVVHYGQANPCGGRLLARDGPVATYVLGEP
jgi:hypothetical protein